MDKARIFGEPKDGTRVEKRSEGGSVTTTRRRPMRRPEITAGMRAQ